MSLSAGSRLGPYEIVESLGMGGMGEVYRATDPRLHRQVAIKVSNEQFSERFEREARAVAALNHPNICHLYDVGSNYLVMELIEGDALNGPLPPERVIDIAGQIAAALEAAHDKGIVHRDLKPANIKITSDGVVKVLDFGLAKMTAAGEGRSDQSLQNSPTLVPDATEAGIILGTAAYMSPEQARGMAVDKRSDIWAFGVVVYELLTGDVMHKGDTLSDTLASVIRDEPKWDKVPVRFRTLLRRCLEKDPKKRLRDIGDAMPLLGTELVAPVQQKILSSKLPWLVAAAFALIAAGLAIVHFREKAPTPASVGRFQIRLPENVHFTSTGAVTVSPDGRHVAISAIADNERPGVWIQSLDEVEAHFFQGTYTGAQPPPFFWSADSRYVVYSENSPKLKKADLQTGTIQDICDKPGPPVGGSWNKDGLIIFGSNSSGLWKVPASGGKPAALTALDPARHERAHELPSFLPDGRHFIYLRHSIVPEESGIYVGSIDDPPEAQNKDRILATGYGASFVPDGEGALGWLVFMRDNNLVAQRFDPVKLKVSGEPSLVAQGVGTTFETGYFSAAANTLVYRATGSIRNYQLTWFDRQGRPVGTIGEPASITNVRVSNDGTAVAYRKDAPNAAGGDIWLFDLKRDVSARFTLGPLEAAFPVFSPDGKEIIFTALDRFWDLYRKPTNGAKEDEALLKSNGYKKPMSWSSDGRFLLYGASESSAFANVDLWILPMQGDAKPRPFLVTRFDEERATFSPNDRWISYESNESGPYQVYVREFVAAGDAAASSGKWIVSKDGGRFPLWRNDGKELVYIALDQQVMSVLVEPGNTFQAGTVRPLFRLPSGALSYSATSDLNRFLVPVPVDAKGPHAFNVMLNWTALLESR